VVRNAPPPPVQEGFSCCQQRVCTVGTGVGQTVGGGGGEGENAPEAGPGRSSARPALTRRAALPKRAR
jgi:hypothetical protein